MGTQGVSSGARTAGGPIPDDQCKAVGPPARCTHPRGTVPMLLRRIRATPAGRPPTYVGWDLGDQ
jgi:hypothetical protein